MVLCLHSSCPIGDAAQQRYYQACLQAVAPTNTIEPALEPVIEYADFCQVALGLPDWPAQPLCNEFGDAAFPFWIGDSCNILCAFGSRHLDDRNVCICDSGYWGVPCNEVCPGGSINPCSGHGICNALSGICTCLPNWKGALDCSLCTPGWLGADCSIAVIPQNLQISIHVRISVIIGISQITTLSGYTFLHYSVGQYYLLRVSDYSLIIQAKYIRCYGSYSCIKYLGLRFGDPAGGFAQVTIGGARISRGYFIVYVNGLEVSIDQTLEFGHSGYVFTRLSYFELQITGPSELKMIVRADGKYLSLDTTLSNSLCSIATGIVVGGCCNASSSGGPSLLMPVAHPDLGLCESNDPIQASAAMQPQTYEFPMNDTTNSTCDGSSTTTTLSDQAIKEFMKSWSVTDCDTVISYPSIVSELQLYASYSLYFHLTAVYTRHVTLFVRKSYDVTFELLIKCAQVIENGGVVFSYSHDVTFALSIESTIKIYVGNMVYNTNLIVQNGKWNKLVLVYEDFNGKLNVYHFTSRGTVKRYLLSIDVHLFRVAGYLTLGSWQPARNATSQLPLKSFSGQIDDFRIWNQYLSPAEVPGLWSNRPETDIPGLVRYWPFDEGEGVFAEDHITGEKLHMPGDPWPQPQWVDSDGPVSDDGLTPPIDPSFDDNDLEIEATDLCERLLYSPPISDVCGDLGEGTIGMYFILCLREVAETHDLGQAYNVAFGFSDICQISLNTSHWPALQLCHEAPTLRAGTQCKDDCLFGVKLPPETCTCLTGFHGEECDNVCPGGSITPCSSHGNCINSGSCICGLNWDGSLDCGTCSSGWYGHDCTVATTLTITTHRPYYLCFVTLHSQYTLFDGLSFHLAAVGEFYLIQTINFIVQIRQVPCFHQSTCVNAIAVRITNTDVVIHAPYQINEIPVIWIDRIKVDFTTNVLQIPNTDWIIEQTDVNYLTLYSRLQIEFHVKIHVLGLFIQVRISTPTETCHASTGLLGNCNNNHTDDLGDGSATQPWDDITQEYINTLIADLWRVPNSDSLFIHQYGIHIETNIPSGAIFSLVLQNTGGRTEPLRNLSSVISQTELTIEFLVKPYLYGGVIISFGLESTFAIINDITIKIVIGSEEYDTGITNDLKTWNRISIVFIREENMLQFYHHSALGAFSSCRFIVEHWLWLDSGVILSIGQWLPSPDNQTYIIDTTFYGELDELRIWGSSFLPTFIQLTDTTNIDAAQYSDLVAMYKFDIGLGSVITDPIFGNDILTPIGPWQKPEWTYSDADIPWKFTAPFDTDFSSDSLQTEAEKICGKLKASDEGLKGICGDLSQASVDFFFLSCLHNVAATGTAESAFATLAVLVEYCQAIGGQAPDTSILCELSTNSSVPKWWLPTCTNCVFGLPNPNDHDACTCLSGYWGDNCTEVCPGGHITPCSNHGVCNNDGQCLCEVNWTGQLDCGFCSNNWLGEDCAIATTSWYKQLIVNLRVMALFTAQGRVVTFGGVSFYIRHAGVYNIFHHASSEIKVNLRLSWCASSEGFSTCFDAISIHHQSHVLIIRASIETTSFSRPYIWLNGKIILLDHTTHISNEITVIRISVIQYKIYMHSLDVSLHISIHPHHFGFSIDMSSDVCKSTGMAGLLASCDTLTNIEHVDCLMNDFDTPIVDNSECRQNASQKAADKYISTFQDNSLVNTSYENYRQLFPVLGAGYHLYFRDSIIISEPLQSLPSERFTLEVWVKVEQYGGILLSYCTTDSVFAIMNLETGLGVYFRNQVQGLNLHIELNHWIQISLVWHRATTILEVYVFDTFGIPQVQAIQLTNAAFQSGGILVIGQWYSVTPVPLPLLPNEPFIGSIDEIRIWNRITNPSLITSNWKLNAGLNTPDLAILWKLNEGIGSVAVDLIGGLLLQFPDWNGPFWRITDEDYPIDAEKPLAYPYFPDDSFAVEATSKCQEIFLSGYLHNSCIALGTAIIDIHYIQCLKDIAFHQDLGAAIEATISVADLAKTQLHLEEWPARYLCNSFPGWDFPYWIGPNCDIPCIFGRKNPYKETECVCDRGYWGYGCTDVCLGGELSPCNDHGECNVTSGLCECHRHWLGPQGHLNNSSYACSHCSPGWFGTDCSISTINRTHTGGLTIFFGHLHFTTLDGASFHFGTPGMFYILTTHSTTVQVLLEPCHASIACREITEVVLHGRQVTLSVGISLEAETRELIVQQKSGLSWMAVEQPENGEGTAGSFKYTWYPSHFINITSSTESIVIIVALYSDSISLVVNTPEGISLEPVALSGTWDDNWINDINVGEFQQGTENDPDNWLQVNNSYFVANLASQNYCDRSLSPYFLIPTDDSYFVSDHAQVFTAAGYILRFKHNRVTFSNVVIKDLDQFTLQCWLRIAVSSSSIQTLMFFESDTSLAIQLDGDMVRVDIDGYVVSTNLVVRAGLWFHLSLSWRSFDGRVTVDLYASDQKVKETSVVYGIQSTKYMNLSGMLHVGQHIIRGDTAGDSLDFEGDLDLVHLKEYFSHGDDLIDGHEQYSEDLADGMIFLIALDEGSGMKATMKLNGPHNNSLIDGLLLPEDTPPEWFPSDAPINAKPEYSPDFPLTTLWEDAVAICDSYFYEEPLYTACKNLQSTMLFYYEACLSDVAASGDITRANVSAYMFALLCQHTLDLPPENFCGFYEFCKEKPFIPGCTWWCILIIVICIILFILVIIIIICWIHKKKKRKNKHDIQTTWRYMRPSTGSRPRSRDSHGRPFYSTHVGPETSSLQGDFTLTTVSPLNEDDTYTDTKTGFGPDTVETTFSHLPTEPFQQDKDGKLMGLSSFEPIASPNENQSAAKAGFYSDDLHNPAPGFPQGLEDCYFTHSIGDQFDPFVDSVDLLEDDPLDVPLPPLPPVSGDFDDDMSDAAGRRFSPPRPPSHNTWLGDSLYDLTANENIEDDNIPEVVDSVILDSPNEPTSKHGHVANVFAADNCSQSSREDNENLSLISPPTSRPGTPSLMGFVTPVLTSSSSISPLRREATLPVHPERPCSADSKHVDDWTFQAPGPHRRADALQKLIKKSSNVVEPSPISSVQESPDGSRSSTPFPIVDLEELEDCPVYWSNEDESLV